MDLRRQKHCDEGPRSDLSLLYVLADTRPRMFVRQMVLLFLDDLRLLDVGVTFRECRRPEPSLLRGYLKIHRQYHLFASLEVPAANGVAIPDVVKASRQGMLALQPSFTAQQ